MKQSGVPSYLLLSWLSLQDVLLPDGVEHAALPTKVSEALFLIVPVHLRKNHRAEAFSSSLCFQIRLINELQDVHLSGQTQDEHRETLHDRGVLVEQ